MLDKRGCNTRVSSSFLSFVSQRLRETVETLLNLIRTFSSLMSEDVTLLYPLMGI